LARTKHEVKPQETMWEAPDRLWERIEPILLEGAPPPPKSHGGRGRIDRRAAFNGIIFRLRTGCQWNRLPEQFGDNGSVHRWFRRWCKSGVFEKIRAVLVEKCDELGAVQWKPRLLQYAAGFKLANDGQDTRSIQHYLGHRDIQHTVRYAAPVAERFKDYWGN
jgi:transposase